MEKCIMEIQLPETIPEAIRAYGEKYVLMNFNRAHTITIQNEVRKAIAEGRCPYGCNKGKKYFRIGNHLKRKHKGD